MDTNKIIEDDEGNEKHASFLFSSRKKETSTLITV